LNYGPYPVDREWGWLNVWPFKEKSPRSGDRRLKARWPN
jgi:hypothetical protein